MPLPLLKVTPKTQNQRVPGYEVPDEDDPVVYRLTNTSVDVDVNAIIWAAYRQIFSEHLILERYRQVALESQLRNRAISVKEFIRGLGKSDVFRNEIADTNSNYRLVDIICKRFLGRASYGKDEQIAWSIVIATQGLHGFIDVILDSAEYEQNFGDSIVPYQRRRMEGRPFNLVNPRYNDYWRNKSAERAGISYYQVRQYQAGALDRDIVRRAIPGNFLSMARGMLTPQVASQRDVARSSSSAIQIPDMTRQDAKPVVQRTKVALPYRYLPTLPKA